LVGSKVSQNPCYVFLFSTTNGVGTQRRLGVSQADAVSQVLPASHQDAQHHSQLFTLKEGLMTFKLASIAISFLFVCSLTGFRAVSQDKRTLTPDAIRTASPVIAAVEGQSYLAPDATEALVCGPASGGRSELKRPGFTRIDFSFGRTRPGSAIGSWVVHNVHLGPPERRAVYLFGGVFTDGSFDPPTTSPSTFDLSGNVTDLGDYCQIRSKGPFEARIWGRCGDGMEINFEVRNAIGVFASTTFRGDSRALCFPSPESAINRTLNQR